MTHTFLPRRCLLAVDSNRLQLLLRLDGVDGWSGDVGDEGKVSDKGMTSADKGGISRPGEEGGWA